MTIKATPSEVYTDITEEQIRAIFPEAPIPLPRTYIKLSNTQQPIYCICRQENNLYEVKLYK